MNLWQKVKNSLNQPSRQYLALNIPKASVKGSEDYNENPIKAGEYYCRFALPQMCLAKGIEWGVSRYPVVYFAIRFKYDGKIVTIPYLTQPLSSLDVKKENLSRVIQCNYSLSPFFPFNGGDVEIQVALFSMKTENAIDKFIKTMSEFSDLLPVPEISTVLNIAPKVYDGIAELIGVGDSKLELGYQQTFSANSIGSNQLKAGYFTTILAEEQDLDMNLLCVVDDKLRIASDKQSQDIFNHSHQLNNHSYMLFRLDIDNVRGWDDLSKIAKWYQIACKNLIQGKNDLVREKLLPKILEEICLSPDITEKDKFGMYQRIKNEFKKIGLQSTNNEMRSLNFLAQQPYPKIDDETKAEFTQLNQIFQ